jgi:hypothetical protein
MSIILHYLTLNLIKYREVHAVVWEIVRRFVNKETVSKYADKAEKGLSTLYDIYISSTYGSNRNVLPLNDSLLSIASNDVITGIYLYMHISYLYPTSQ